MRQIVILILSLLLPAATAARPAFYWVTHEGSHLLLGYLSLADSDFRSGADGNIGGTRSMFSAQYEFAGGKPWVLGLGHQYSALDIDTATASSARANGDLHTLHLALDWRRSLGPGELHLALAPAVSTSSNGLKNPDQLDSDALQLWCAAIYRWPGAAQGEWVAGLASDTRFGNQRLYPVLGLQWWDSHTTLRAAYPDLLLTRRLGERWSASMSISPDGNYWQAYDRELENGDEFRREAWQAGLGLDYGLPAGFRLGLRIGYFWDQAWRFRRLDGGWARLDSDNSAYVGVQLGWFKGLLQE